MTDPIRKIFQLAGVILAITMLPGCVTARSLARTAEQNQRNIAELTKGTQALDSLANRFAAASKHVYLSNRIDDIADELATILGPPDSLVDGKTWDELFNNDSDLQSGRQYVKTNLSIHSSDAEKEAMARTHGWIYKSVIDSSFSPAEAKGFQQRLDLLDDMYSSSGQNGEYIMLATRLLRQIDPQLEYRAEVCDGLDEILKQLTQQIDRQLVFAERHAAKFVEASEADAQVQTAVTTVLSSDEAGQLVESLASKHVEDESVREGILNLYRDFSGFWEE